MNQSVSKYHRALDLPYSSHPKFCPFYPMSCVLPSQCHLQGLSSEEVLRIWMCLPMAAIKHHSVTSYSLHRTFVYHYCSAKCCFVGTDLSDFPPCWKEGTQHSGIHQPVKGQFDFQRFIFLLWWQRMNKLWHLSFFSIKIHCISLLVFSSHAIRQFSFDLCSYCVPN
jgi:hypothetical protein